MCAWRLPADASCASVARSLLRIAMTTLGLGGDMADDAMLAASELATNALNHGLRAGPSAPIVPPELWVWARAAPAPQLVVSVFDTCRSSWPDAVPKDLLDENGKGIGIVGAVADAWGAHLSRSWIEAGGVRGKAVWSAFALPGPWPNARTTAPPRLAARHLASMLTSRGIKNIVHRHGTGVSLVSVRLRAGSEMNVWIEPACLGFAGADGSRVHRPVVDLYDVIEGLMRRCEEECDPG